MNKFFTNIFLAGLLLFCLSPSSLSAQFDYEFCGSTFHVNCDGTVEVDLNDQVFIYKVWDGDQLIVEFNNFTPGPNVITVPFIGGMPPNGNPVSADQNVYLDIQTTCGNYILNISDILSEFCPDVTPPTNCFDVCGSEICIDCDGRVCVDLANNVDIYKVWNGGTLIAELNNYTGPSVIYDPFCSTDVGGALVPPGENFYLDIQTTDCGNFTLNISAILSDNCPDFARDSPDRPPSRTELDDRTDRGDRGGRKSFGKPATDLAGKLITGMTAFPNPVSGRLTIDLPLLEKNFDVRLLNMNGQVVTTYVTNGGRRNLDVSALPTGLYFLKATSGKENYTERIQVVR